jgi:hypothetical protein
MQLLVALGSGCGGGNERGVVQRTNFVTVNLLNIQGQSSTSTRQRTTRAEYQVRVKRN